MYSIKHEIRTESYKSTEKREPSSGRGVVQLDFGHEQTKVESERPKRPLSYRTTDRHRERNKTTEHAINRINRRGQNNISNYS
jgi:hypothetical protein